MKLSPPAVELLKQLITNCKGVPLSQQTAFIELQKYVLHATTVEVFNETYDEHLHRILEFQ